MHKAVQERRVLEELPGHVPADLLACWRHVLERSVRSPPELPVVGEVGNRAVARLGLGHGALHAASPAELEDERGDQHALQDNDDQPEGNRLAVLLEQPPRAVEHDARGRKHSVRESPAFQLACIERRREPRVGQRDGRGPLPAENAEREIRCDLPDALHAHQLSTEDAGPEVLVDDAEHRPVTRPGNPRQGSGVVVVTSGRVLEEAAEEDQRIVPQLRDLFLHLLE